MQDDEFEWDDEKARSNLTKHKVDFRTARLVFLDPAAVDDLDDSMDYGEERFQLIGMVNGRLLAVSNTLRQLRIRIISARCASSSGHSEYARQNPPDES